VSSRGLNVITAEKMVLNKKRANTDSAVEPEPKRVNAVSNAALPATNEGVAGRDIPLENAAMKLEKILDELNDTYGDSSSGEEVEENENHRENVIMMREGIEELQEMLGGMIDKLNEGCEGKDQQADKSDVPCEEQVEEEAVVKEKDIIAKSREKRVEEEEVAKGEVDEYKGEEKSRYTAIRDLLPTLGLATDLTGDWDATPETGNSFRRMEVEEDYDTTEADVDGGGSDDGDDVMDGIEA